uniref:Uncharacterized protein n=1 Tax=Cannabis sativa TaxID=3483 RepID=A0A803QHI6_CANSA
MTFLKQAPVFNCKSKTGTTTPSFATPQKRKSDFVPTQAADLSKKQQKVAQDKGKKVVIDLVVKVRDIMVLHDKFVTDEFVTRVEGTLVEELLSRLTNLISQLMTVYSRAYDVCFKDLDLLKKQNSALQKGLKKAKLDAAAKDKEVEDLSMAKGQAEEQIKTLNERVKKLEEENAGLGGNLFPDDVGDATAAEVIDGTNMVVGDSNAPAA